LHGSKVIGVVSFSKHTHTPTGARMSIRVTGVTFHTDTLCLPLCLTQTRTAYMIPTDMIVETKFIQLFFSHQNKGSVHWTNQSFHIRSVLTTTNINSVLCKTTPQKNCPRQAMKRRKNITELIKITDK